METYSLDELDHKILQLISNDARISFLEVARICSVSGAAVHQRIQKMTNNEILTGSQFSLNYNKIGYNTSAFVSLKLKDSVNGKEFVQKLQDIAEVTECHSTFSQQEFIIKIYATDNNKLASIFQTQIAPLGVESSNFTITCKENFNRQISFNESK